MINLLKEQNLNWIYYHYKNKKGVSDTWEIYYTPPNNAFRQLAEEIMKRKSISSFSNAELTKALETLKTSNCRVKLKLKNLLTKYLGGKK